MTYITWEERQTNVCLFEKTLNLKTEKYCSAKISCLSKYYDIHNHEFEDKIPYEINLYLVLIQVKPFSNKKRESSIVSSLKTLVTRSLQETSIV